MWRSLQCDTAQDFVIGTGVAHTVEELCKEAFAYVGADWSRHVEVEQALMRPRDAAVAVADPTKAARVLGWQAKVGFVELVHKMVDHHYSRLAGPR
jgi:GDPmannose 4,6-dehydratase